MGVRNSKELGANLFQIAKRLLSNQSLLKYLKCTSADPLEHDNIENPFETVLHNNIKVVPLVDEDEFNSESKIVVVFEGGEVESSNTEYVELSLDVLVYVPLSQWQINDINLRPFLIMSEIENSLKNKRVEGLGVMNYHGFDLSLLTDKTSCYKMRFSFDVFN